jgi:hypothetical protein
MDAVLDLSVERYTQYIADPSVVVVWKGQSSAKVKPAFIITAAQKYVMNEVQFRAAGRCSNHTIKWQIYDS